MLKLSFLLSVALGIVLVTASVVLWSVLDAMGVFCAVNNELRSIGSANTKFDINQWVGLGRVVSLTTVIAVVNVLIIMALSTLGARAVQPRVEPRRRPAGDPLGRLTRVGRRGRSRFGWAAAAAVASSTGGIAPGL